MQKSVILIDIGNTSISIGLARSGRICNVSCLSADIRDSKTVRRILLRLSRSRGVKDSALCSVVPSLNAVWIRELRRITGLQPLVINHRLHLDVSLNHPEPSTIGADRLANSCAAVSRYGTPVIVVDFGTALTFDVISKNREYLGGVIAPGLPLMTDYLYEKTALLPHLHLQRLKSRWKTRNKHNVIGKSTIEAMMIGASRGYIGMIKEIVDGLRKELKPDKLRLCATGGYASWALAGSGLKIPVYSNLTLYGISRIYKLNRDVTKGKIETR